MVLQARNILSLFCECRLVLPCVPLLSSPPSMVLDLPPGSHGRTGWCRLRSDRGPKGQCMADSTIISDRGIDATGFALITGAEAEQALRSAIQNLEQLGDSPLELAQALIKLGTLRQERGAHAEAEELFRNALDTSERTLGSDHIELVQPLMSLGGARLLRGSPETAEPFLQRALTISTRYLGEDHPDLVLMVNDLARLYLKQGAYAFAEPLLQRLLAMKRSKGDDHPEVATVLASLAAVRQARGQHESAEELWRHVLAIRERTLAPNHFAQAIALEHLADTCAARGKFGEALELFQRALVIRELTLGNHHFSLRILRERIADLQLQASEDSFDCNQVGKKVVVGFVGHEAPRPFEGNPGARRPMARSAAAGTLEDREAIANAYKAALSNKRQLVREEGDEEGIGPAKGVFSSAARLTRKHRGEIFAVAGIIAFLVIAFATSTGASSETDQVTTELPLHEPATITASPLSAPALSNPQAATSNHIEEAQPAATLRAESKATLPDSAPTIPKAIQRRVRPTYRSPEKVIEQPSEPAAAFFIPVVPTITTSRFDSIVRAAAMPVKMSGESFKVPASIGTSNPKDPKFDYAVRSTPQPSRARLIGTLPAPRYPDQLSNIEGEVLVSFEVDTAGRALMATFTAVSSSHPLFTEAVRKVISSLRFEPARTGGPGSRPIVDKVQLRSIFTRPMK
jgi:TonB family protein